MEMMAGTGPDKASPCPPTRPATGRTIADLVLDRRTREFKRKSELVAMFAESLGEAAADPNLARKIDLAAELAVVAEKTRAAFLRGDGTADDCVRTSRAAGLAERALGLHARTNSKPDLNSYLAARRDAA